ncbi:MAG: hypothetical protein M1821_009648 [Bathelium mastoideum]|nr:MAG: hypothetical protein M1821_009648 [Bathelium mastoideum]
MRATTNIKSATRPRKWTEAEDRELQREAEIQLKHGSISDWKTIASKIRGRTNKDCRKRWSKISNSIVKGTWEVDEDARLQRAVAAHGFRWSQVAEQVGTRNADQCVKRWQHSLDPSVDRSTWKPDEDQQLLDAVAECGRSWTIIAETRFQRRSTTDIKNRYAIIRRRLCQKKGAQRLSLPTCKLSSENEPEIDSEADEESSGESVNDSIPNQTAPMDCDVNLDKLDFSSLPALTPDAPSFLDTSTPMSSAFPSSELLFDMPMSQSTAIVNSNDSAESDMAAFSSFGETPLLAHNDNHQFNAQALPAPNIQSTPDAMQSLLGVPQNTILQTEDFDVQDALTANREKSSRVKSLTLTLEDVDPGCINRMMEAALEMRSARVSMHVDP